MRSLVLVALALASGAHVAHADDAPSSYREVIDRVELEPSSITGDRLRIYLSALSLDGQRLDLTDPKSIRLYVGTAQKTLPLALGTYDATDTDTAIVVLVQATIDFTEALPTIADALDRELVAKLSPHAQLAIAMFGDGIGKLKLAPAKSLKGKVALASDGSAIAPGLLDAIDRALTVLKKARAAPEGQPEPALRELIVVIGDGRDLAVDKDRVTALGKRAAKDGVRIHAIAYSPADTRRPLLVLGELAKRSLGTFRWPGRGRKPTADSWSDAFAQLHTEIDKQYVLTYFVTADDDIAGKHVHIATSGRTEASSNEAKVPDGPECAGAPCDGYCATTCVTMHGQGGRGIAGWLLIIVVGIVGAVVVLGLIGFLMSKQQQRRQQPAMPACAGVPMPPTAGVPTATAVAGGKRAKRAKRASVHDAAAANPAAVAAAAAAAASAAGLLPSGRPIPGVLVMSGPLAGQRFTLRNGFMIGKQPGCDLLIEDGYTSSQHAQIGMDAAGNCVLYDRGSTNGTFVNNVPVQQQPLAHGATIRIGSTELRFLAQ